MHNKPLTINYKRAFTLIEILVVIAIMAVLAGGLLYSTNNAREKGKDARRKDDLKTLGTALVAYYADNNKYPPAAAGGQLDYVSDAANPWIPDLEPYLNKFPKDPLQAALFAPLAAVAENGKKIASSSWSWLTTNQTAQKPKGQVAAAATFGYGNQGPSFDCCDGGNMQGTKFPMGASSGTVSKMSVYVGRINTSISHNFVLSIYSDNNGAPGIVVASSSVGTLAPGDGWKELPVTNTILYANTNYWLMYSTDTPIANSNNNNPAVSGGGGTNNFFYTSYTLGSGFPVNPTGTYQNDTTYSIFATYEPITSGIYSAKVSNSLDDGKRQMPNNLYENTIEDTPVGTYFNCGQGISRSNYFRFTGVQIPNSAHIISAKITFAPRTDRVTEDQQQNSATLTTFYSKLRGELSDNATYITDPNNGPNGSATDFTNRVNTKLTQDLDSVEWDNIPVWYPRITPGVTDTPDISIIIQKIVNQGTWNDTISRAINIFWLDNGTTGCVGRNGISYDGELTHKGIAPRLTITWGASAPPTTCTDLTATNFGQLLPCTYASGTPATGACDGKPTNVYCIRISANQKVFVLWAMLENANDPQLYTNTTTALCNSSDPDFSTSHTNTSPYKGLDHFTGSAFNYCLKSPQ